MGGVESSHPARHIVSIAAPGRAEALREGGMTRTWRRFAPLILTSLLIVTLITAFIAGGQGRWLVVAILALALALTLWPQRPTQP
jgi:hypothetical protein